MRNKCFLGYNPPVCFVGLYHPFPPLPLQFSKIAVDFYFFFTCLRVLESHYLLILRGIRWLSLWKPQLGCFHPFVLALPSSPSSPIFKAGRSAIILTDIQAQQTSGLACLLSERSCQFTSAFQSAAMRSAVPGSGKLCARPASSLSPLSPPAGRAAAAPQAETDRPRSPNLRCEMPCWQSRCHLKYLGSTGGISPAGSELPRCPSGDTAALALALRRRWEMVAPGPSSTPIHRASAGLEAAWHLPWAGRSPSHLQVKAVPLKPLTFNDHRYQTSIFM